MIAPPASHIDEPFAITPDPRFVYWSVDFQSTYDALLRRIELCNGLMLLVGPAGCGKTTLLRTIQDALTRSGRLTFFRSQPGTSTDALLHSLLAELRINSPPCAPEDCLRLLAQHVDRCKPGATLLVDEAHCFTNAALEDVAELATPARGAANGLQVILTGRPDLEDRIRRPELSRVAERVKLTARLGPLGRGELSSYVAHRLAVAGYPDDLFMPGALDSAFEYSRGVPRAVNRLCARALSPGAALIDRTQMDLAACEGGATQAAITKTVAKARAAIPPAPPVGVQVGAADKTSGKDRRRVHSGYVAVVLACAGVGLGLFYFAGPGKQFARLDLTSDALTPGWSVPAIDIEREVWTDSPAEAAAPKPGYLIMAEAEQPAQAEVPPEPAAPYPEAAPRKVSDAEHANHVSAYLALGRGESMDAPSDGLGESQGPPPSEMRGPAPADRPSGSIGGSTANRDNENGSEAQDEQPVAADRGSSPVSARDPVLQEHVGVDRSTNGDPHSDDSGSAPPRAEEPATPQQDATAHRVPNPLSNDPGGRPASGTATAASTLDIRLLMTRGYTLLQQGDPAAGRLFFERAAAQGDSAGMRAVGQTFDPLELRRLGVIGIAGDADRALAWYRRAVQTGDQAAMERIAQLENWMALQHARR
jgi:general secretion pathway protein A